MLAGLLLPPPTNIQCSWGTVSCSTHIVSCEPLEVTELLDPKALGMA